MSSSRRQTKRALATIIGMLLLVVLVTSSVLLFTPKVHGDEPANPLADLNSATVVSAQATTEAADQADEQVVADARSGTLPDTKDLVATPAPEPVETAAAQTVAIPSGISVPQILNGGWGSKYKITNMWSGVVGSSPAYVIAGSKADDPAVGYWGSPEQGMVLVSVGSADSQQEYLTPSKNGKIQITAYSGTCLTLSTNLSGLGSGTTYHFDVATLQWSCTP